MIVRDILTPIAPTLRRRLSTTTAIAIDGPVASGKSSAGSRVAAALGWPFVDTGTTYRALTWLALRRGVRTDDAAALGRLAATVSMRVHPPTTGANSPTRVDVDGEDATPFLRKPEVERNVSAVSAVPEVRARMVALQRQLAEHGPVVMAGRDIGTVVLPNARLKLYLDASAETRAARRADELAGKGTPRALATVLAETRARDAIDSGRDLSPLRPADDAIVLATDGVSEDEVVARILALAHERLGTPHV
jgi:cytidylate kinase